MLSGHGAHPCPDNTVLLGHGFCCPGMGPPPVPSQQVLSGHGVLLGHVTPATQLLVSFSQRGGGLAT